MNEWTTENGVPRGEAVPKIRQMANDQGIRGTYKVYYDGRIVASESDLPSTVDMSKVRVSAQLNNASDWNTEEEDENILSRDEAAEFIRSLAREQGIRGTFKVYYDGRLVSSESALPNEVDKTLLRVSAQLNNA